MHRFFRIFRGILLTALLAAAFPLALSAEEAQARCLTVPELPAALADGNFRTRATVSEPLTIEGEEPAAALYLSFYETPTALTLSDGTRKVSYTASYLHEYIDLTELFGTAPRAVTLTFEETTELTDLYLLSPGVLPEWVQRWSPHCEKADLLLLSSHADDDQLFFAGVLPTYAGERGNRVQVVYFTDHKKEPHRRHELLNGLWTVGVTAYPVINTAFPDHYSASIPQAIATIARYGYTEEDAVRIQVELLRRFRPQVVLGHDLEGEYGHGMHRLSAACLTKSVPLAADPDYDPASAEKYGVWDTPKLYLHSYPQNEIVLNWDLPLKRFGGKTAYQMSREGFDCHVSQNIYWFRQWLRGNRDEYTSATQIQTYSPCKFGLYRTTVGPDWDKNDFFEHLMPYKEQEARADLQAAVQEEIERLNETVPKLRQAVMERFPDRTAPGTKPAPNASAAPLWIAAGIAGGGAVLLCGFLLIRKKKRNPGTEKT